MWTLAFVDHLDFFVDCCYQKRDRFFRHKNFLGIKPWSKHFGSKSSKWSKHREPRRRTWTTSTLRVQSWRLRMEMKVKAKVVQSFNFEENEKRFWSCLMNQSFVLCVFWLANWDFIFEKITTCCWECLVWSCFNKMMEPTGASTLHRRHQNRHLWTLDVKKKFIQLRIRLFLHRLKLTSGKSFSQHRC